MADFFAAAWDFLSSNAIALVLSSVIAYLLGSISFAVIISRIFTGEDVRTKGSGNAGMTNVLRSVGKLPGILTAAGDLAKTAAAILIGGLIFRYLGEPSYSMELRMMYATYLSGFFCMIGHLFPVYFRFKGGKGVLTTAGMILFVDWRIFLIEIGIFVIVILLSKMVSMGSIVAAACYPVSNFIVTFFLDYQRDPTSDRLTVSIMTTIVTAIIGGIVIFKHRSNLKRIIRGEEKKFNRKKVVR